MAEILHYLSVCDYAPRQPRIVWLTKHDAKKLNEHLLLCGQRPMKRRRYKKMYRRGVARYCLLYVDDVPAAWGAVEPYSKSFWEAADIRVVREYCGTGLAKEMLRFLSHDIIRNGKIATCRTEEDNLAMQGVLRAVGYEKQNPLTASESNN